MQMPSYWNGKWMVKNCHVNIFYFGYTSIMRGEDCVYVATWMKQGANSFVKNTELNISEDGRRNTSFIVKKRKMLTLCRRSLVSIFQCQQVSVSSVWQTIKGQQKKSKDNRKIIISKSDRIEIGNALVNLVMMIHFGKEAACGFCLSEHRLSVAPWKATLTPGNHLANPNRSCKQNVGYQMNFKIKYIIFIARLAATKVFD